MGTRDKADSLYDVGFPWSDLCEEGRKRLLFGDHRHLIYLDHRLTSI